MTYDIDRIETYIATLYGTLNEYYRTGEKEYITLIWCLIRSLKINTKYISHVPMENNITKQLEMTEKLAKFIIQRDTSRESAIELRKLKSVTHVSNYFWSLYQLNEAHQRNHQMGLWDIIFGLLTQPQLNNGVTVTGMRDHFLRMIWERSGKYIDTINLTICMDMEDIVKKLHIKIGNGIVFQLQFWGFIMDVIEINNDTLNVFTNKIELLKKKYKNNGRMKNSTLLSLAIAPDSRHYLTDKGIAETILQASQAHKKDEMLNVEALVSSTPNTLCLNTILSTNLAKAKKLQEAIERLKAFKTGNPESIFSLFLPPHVSHIYSEGNSEKIRATFYNYIKADNLDVVLYLYEKCRKTNLIGERRLLAMLKRFAPIGSNIYEHFDALNILPNIQPCDMKKYDRIMNNVISMLDINIDEIANAENIILKSEEEQRQQISVLLNNEEIEENEFIPVIVAVINAQ